MIYEPSLIFMFSFITCVIWKDMYMNLQALENEGILLSRKYGWTCHNSLTRVAVIKFKMTLLCS